MAVSHLRSSPSSALSPPSPAGRPARCSGIPESVPPLPGTPLTRGELTSVLPGRVTGLLRELRIFPGLDSTNAYLERLRQFTDIHGVAVLAESQSAGRGRGGRSWVSPFGGVYLSVGWEEPPVPPGTLTLWAALWCLRALLGLGLTGLRIKWPNDLLHVRGKCGGLLGTRLRGSRRVVLGVGVNVHPLEPGAHSLISQAHTSLAECCPGDPPARPRVAAALTGALLEGLAELRDSPGRFRRVLPAQFAPYDFLAGRTLKIRRSDGVLCSGVAAGIDAGGALLLREPGGGEHHIEAGRLIAAGQPGGAG